MAHVIARLAVSAWDYVEYADEKVDPFFREYLKAYGYYDIFLICKAHGHVMYTAARESDLGSNLKVGSYRDSGLAKLWSKVLKEKRTSMVDFSLYGPSKEAAAFIGAPVLDEDGKIVAVVALQISIKQINAIVQERTGMGKSGETYIVGEDLLMRTDSRFEKESTILKTKVDTVAVQRALEDKEGVDIIEDYRGEKVLSCYTNVGLSEKFGTDFEWVIVSEIDEAEAFAPVKALNLYILIVGIVGLFAIIGVALLFTLSITRPTRKGTDFAKEMSDGDFTNTLDIDQEDEIGVLARALNLMVSSLGTMVKDLKTGVDTLSSSSTELSAISQQMSSGAEQTSSKSNTVSAAAEEMSANMSAVAAATEQASTNVSMVATASEEMTATISEIAENTEKARSITEKAVSEARSASETVDELGKAAREIGEGH